MSIVILVSKGMVGSAVARYFENNSVEFLIFDERFSLEDAYSYL